MCLPSVGQWCLMIRVLRANSARLGRLLFSVRQGWAGDLVMGLITWTLSGHSCQTRLVMATSAADWYLLGENWQHYDIVHIFQTSVLEGTG